MNIMLILGIALLVILLLALLLNLRKIGPGLHKLRTFFHEVQAEMQKVTWPSKPEVINGTILVGITVFMVTVMVGIVDKVIGWIVQRIFV